MSIVNAKRPPSPARKKSVTSTSDSSSDEEINTKHNLTLKQLNNLLLQYIDQVMMVVVMMMMIMMICRCGTETWVRARATPSPWTGTRWTLCTATTRQVTSQ